jgi:hypothetical protein
MANLITYADFINEINIPISDSTTTTAITNAITQYQPEVLQDLLGYSLYKAFIAGLSVNTPAQKWVNLRDGAEFSVTIGDETRLLKFDGVKPIIAYYVYLRYRNDNETYFSGQKQVKSETENSITADYDAALVPVFNSFIRKYGIVDRYIYSLSNNSYYEHTNFSPSAYNFLLANITSYNDWVFTQKQFINEYGI